MKNNKLAERNVIVVQKNPWPKRIAVIGCCFLLAGVIFCSIFFPLHYYFQNKVSLKTIKKAWSEYNYESVYNQSKEYLEIKPYNNKALTYFSYSSFFLAQSQNENQKAQNYLDDCINNLRITIYKANDSLKPQLYYMLGRAYFYKNSISSHYYADLAIKYLLMAKDCGYESDDIPEYLGLSYANLGMTMESISAFTEALLIRESDTLLLSIAEQYYKLGEANAAKQYLFRITKDSKNNEIILKAYNLLGTIYLEENELDSASQIFNQMLELNPDSADAYFGLGRVEELQGNIVKARAQWRIARKLQPNHTGVLQKLNEY